MIVTALQNFDHGRKVKRGDTLNVTRQVAEQLRDKRLVSLNGVAEENPPLADGETALSSASPAARVSRQKTSKPSDDGGKKKAKKEAEKSS